MKIGCVGCDNLKINKSNTGFKTNNNFASQISFKGSIDSFEKQTNFDTLKALIKEHDTLLDKIQTEIKTHKKNTSGFIQKAVEIQKNANLGTDKTTFGTLHELLKHINTNIAKVYDPMQDSLPIRELAINYGDGYGESFWSGAYFLFQSKDKQLAKDAASLYPFYSKAKWNIEKFSTNLGTLKLMLANNFNFDSATVKKPEGEFKEKVWADLYQDNLAQVLEKSKENAKLTGRPSFIVADDLEVLLNKNTNSHSNIAEMKFILNASVEHFRSIFLAGTGETIDPNIDKGTIQPNRLVMQTNLDKAGFGKGDIELLKNAQKDLGKQTEEISQILNQIPIEDKKRIMDLNESILKLYNISCEIKDNFCKESVKEQFDEISLKEYEQLMFMKPVKSYTEHLSDFIAGFSDTNKEALEEQFIQGTKKLSKNKMFALGALAVGVCAAVGFFIKKKFFPKAAK